MAGYWIKFETSTSDKPEVWAIAESLSIDPDAVVGKLLRVWAWFDDHTEKGNAPSVTKALLDRRVGVTGFCDAMILSGWMIEDGEVVCLPNFDRHNGATAKSRCLTAKRVATHKKGNAEGNAKGNGDSVTSSVSSALPRREEKRREVNTHTPTQNGQEQITPGFVPEECEDAWNRWMELWRMTHGSGQPMPMIQQEQWAMELRRREDRMLADLEFSIRHGSKSLLDHRKDFSKQSVGRQSTTKQDDGLNYGQRALKRLRDD
jgi:hypothetical protein